MAVPDFQSFFLPLLQYCSDGETHSVKEAYEAMSVRFGLSEEDLREMIPSGKQTTFRNRVAWANVYLAKAMLVERPQRGFFRITERGKKILAQNPTTLRVKDLKQYAEFAEFHTAGKGQDNVSTDSISEERQNTPDEVFGSAFQKLRNNLAGELLEGIAKNSPKFFEDLVVELLLKMGYGNFVDDAGQVTGRSGDEGIDGIINQDKLGLDAIYLQAKKWDKANPIGRPEIQKFVGALHGKRARKGVFITTSYFAQPAKDYVKNIESKVVLIDGKRLAELMIDFNLGVSTKQTYEIKEYDSDFFVEE